MMRCPVCRRTHHGLEAMLEHLTTHSHLVLAETILELVQPCGKKRFSTQPEAERALVINTISLSPNRREVRAYKCVQCRPTCWHLTSGPQRIEVTTLKDPAPVIVRIEPPMHETWRRS
jgi:hypothetical protein